jgi:hypothetical protein
MKISYCLLFSSPLRTFLTSDVVLKRRFPLNAVHIRYCTLKVTVKSQNLKGSLRRNPCFKYTVNSRHSSVPETLVSKNYFFYTDRKSLCVETENRGEIFNGCTRNIIFFQQKSYKQRTVGVFGLFSSLKRQI